MWGALLGAGLTLANSFMGDKGKNQLGEGQGFKDSGWGGDKGGFLRGSSIQEGPVDRNATVEAKEPKSKWDWANEVAGSTLGKIGTDVAGGFLSDKRSQRNSRKQFDRLRGEGLTAVEIAGGGGSGGAVAAQGNTLGNGPQRQAKSQQDFLAGQKALDRETQLKAAEIGARAPGVRAQTDKERGGREQELQHLNIKKAEADVARMRIQTKRAGFDLENVWAMKFASMSMENGMFALAAFNQGIDFRTVLANKGGTAQDKRDAQELLKIMNILNKSAGGAVAWGDLADYIRKGQNNLGGPSMFKPQKLRVGKEGGSSSGKRGASGTWKGATGKW